MSRAKGRAYQCQVVHEEVRIDLRGRRSVGLRKVEGYYVHCDQQECQYAAENKPPCPLDPSMLPEEMAELEERRRRRREG